MSTNKTIVKNTLFLYFRMLLTMGVGLYTSRLVLEVLGVSDYGIYSLVGGFVVMIGFINGAMSTATQRYLSIDIGKNNKENLKKTFSATLTIHLGIAGLVLLLAETIGLWYVNYVMVFPPERTYAVNVVYQFSIFTFLTGIIQVPYNALIIVREKMKVYASVSIIEVILKLVIVMILPFYGKDKLIIYSILFFLTSLIIRIIYQIYCSKKFEESRYKFEYNKSYYKELINYSGWNLFGNLALVSKNQGVNLILNLFFGTIINASYAIAIQVQGVLSMFVSNFQTAVNPQILIKYAKGNINESHSLILQSSKLSFFLLSFILVPIFFNTDYILTIWLGIPPQLSVIFVKFSLVVLLIDSLSGSLMTGIQATGKIKGYQIVVGLLQTLNLPLSYVFLKWNFSASVVFIISIFISLIALQLRLFYLHKTSKFNTKEFYRLVILRVCFVIFVVFLLSYILKKSIFNSVDNFLVFIMQSLILLLVTGLAIVFFGLTKKELKFIKSLIIK